MKKTWETPKASVQEFEANEYVAACWAIACKYGISGGNNGCADPVLPDRTDITHTKLDSGNGCGWSKNQYIYDNANGSYSVTEIHTSGLGDLNTKLSHNGYGDLASTISNVQAGQTIFWTTTSGDRTWYHKGTVENTYPGHPNRS